MSNQDDDITGEIGLLNAQMAVGDMAHKFLTTPVGKFLIDRAYEEEKAAFKEFLEVDPTDSHAVRGIQERGRAPKLVFVWLSDAIRDGAEANQQFAELIKEMSDE